jgi:hypothetical protein
MKFDDQDKAALRKLDNDFTITPDGEGATIAGEMEICVVRLADDDGNRFLLTLTFPNGEELEVRMSRAQLLEQLDIES